MSTDLARQFLESGRPHVLMISNHGIHDWKMRSGITDTGGQNHYVISLSDTFAAMGFRTTTFNRGGFPDPITNEPRRGFRYKDAFSRIVYLEGGGSSFIRKEDLNRAIISEEVGFAHRFIEREKTPIDLIISHYWDGALLASMLKQKASLQAKHLWIPHSLGALKLENISDQSIEFVESLHLDERISYEKEILGEVDAVASTSSHISRVLEDFYDRRADLFVPPCINTIEIHPIGQGSKPELIYDFLEKTDPKTGGKARGKACILEMSRTDRTKRKDIVIRSFARLLDEFPDAMLLMRLDPQSEVVYKGLTKLIDLLGIRENIVQMGMVPSEIISELYAISSAYVSPSEMEDFGMSVQEACACRRPVVASDHVPFAVEYLLYDTKTEFIDTETGYCAIKWGAGGVVVPAGNVEGFAYALERLLSDEGLRERMGNAAYNITIPRFTWSNLAKRLLDKMGIKNAS
jgi:glycosyltransferase involved in cell wall biosynthesis